MDEITPTTEEVSDVWARPGRFDGPTYVRASEAEFDRWLNEHTAQALERAAESVWALVCGDYYNPNMCETCRAVESLREEAEALRSGETA